MMIFWFLRKHAINNNNNNVCVGKELFWLITPWLWSLRSYWLWERRPDPSRCSSLVGLSSAWIQVSPDWLQKIISPSQYKTITREISLISQSFLIDVSESKWIHKAFIRIKTLIFYLKSVRCGSERAAHVSGGDFSSGGARLHRSVSRHLHLSGCFHRAGARTAWDLWTGESLLLSKAAFIWSKIRVAKRWKISSKFRKHYRNLGNQHKRCSHQMLI